jgi:hypothetical protein
MKRPLFYLFCIGTKLGLSLGEGRKLKERRVFKNIFNPKGRKFDGEQVYH